LGSEKHSGSREGMSALLVLLSPGLIIRSSVGTRKEFSPSPGVDKMPTSYYPVEKITELYAGTLKLARSSVNSQPPTTGPSRPLGALETRTYSLQPLSTVISAFIHFKLPIFPNKPVQASARLLLPTMSLVRLVVRSLRRIIRTYFRSSNLPSG
jgi:hypothetical protein